MPGTCAIIPAAGRGVRFGSVDKDGLPQNKVFAEILGRPLLAWTLAPFVEADKIDSILLVGSEGDLPRLREIADAFGGGKVADVVLGGATRQESVYKALTHSVAAESEFIVVHDGARPCIDASQVVMSVMWLRKFDALTWAFPVADSFVRAVPNELGLKDGAIMGESVPRDGLWAIQTPQAFWRDVLQKAHETARSDDFFGTDDASLVRRIGTEVMMVKGSQDNIKVTQLEDLSHAERTIRARLNFVHGAPPFAVGHGYDIHRFADGRRMVLGGIEWENAPRGLLGHSDADALLHALCDALLGAAGLGDIGTFFPPSDDAHKDRPSMEFLRIVMEKVNALGWRVGNADITILAEWPKITPMVPAMKQGISDVLQIELDKIAIKATTNEGLGAIGRGEGIAVHATVLLFR